MMLTVSALCMCVRCTSRTGEIYRMVGACSNCGTKDILILFRAGDQTREVECPVCKVRQVRSIRLATDDEIPAATPPDEAM